MASYEGSSAFLRWWPKILLVAAAWAQGHFIPWRFKIFDDGLVLTFPFGRRVFLPKSTTTVRLETVGAVAVIEGNGRLGYLLHDGLLYVPDQRLRLHRGLNFYGYRVV